jgi:hypothetical protein
VLTFFAAGAIEKMVAADLAVFEAPGVSVTLHPADMMIVASKVEGRQLRSHLAESMAFSEAHLTWSKPGNDLEDRLTILAKGLERRRLKAAAARLQLVHIEREMRKADIPFEEWEVLFRNKLLVEREVLRAEGSVVRAVSDVVSAAAPVAEAAAAAGLFNRFLGSIGNAVFSALYARLRKAS